MEVPNLVKRVLDRDKSVILKPDSDYEDIGSMEGPEVLWGDYLVQTGELFKGNHNLYVWISEKRLQITRYSDFIPEKGVVKILDGEDFIMSSPVNSKDIYEAYGVFGHLYWSRGYNFSEERCKVCPDFYDPNFLVSIIPVKLFNE